MNEAGPNLVTTYAFKGGKEFVVKMTVVAFKGCQRCLELTVTDKYTAENWHSSYDTAYVENLTHKTGNYKQFDVFVAMLQSGLLKTSESITLDLFTFEDLELLCAQKIDTMSAGINHKNNNRRYLILTYSVEFDRIHYPLPLDYCGPPDPVVLQGIIRKLKIEIERLQSTRLYKDLQKRIEHLTIVNQNLAEENRKLANSGKGIQRLLVAVKTLENSVAKERASFRAQIQKLRSDNSVLTSRINQLLESTTRKPGPRSPASKRKISPFSSRSRHSNNRRNRSRSPSVFSQPKTSCSSPSSVSDSQKFRRRLQVNKDRPCDSRAKEFDICNLESRIHMLQRMLKEGINLT